LKENYSNNHVTEEEISYAMVQNILRSLILLSVFPVTQECDIPKNETSSLVCVDADAIDCDNASTRVRPRTVGEDLNTEEGNSAAPHLTSLSHEHDPCFPVDGFDSKMIFSEHVTRISCHEAPLLGESQLNCALRDGPPSSVCWLLLSSGLCFQL
jgi:hypothetical protein